MDSNSNVLTVVEAARELRVCAQTIYALARSGELPSLKLGRRVLIPRQAIERMIERAASKAA